MIIKKVMFSGPKESNRPEDLIKFVQNDNKKELGVYFTQHASKGNPRYDWAHELGAKLSEQNIQATLQIGWEWCEDFCNGKTSSEVSEMLNFSNNNNKKTFKNIQLNFLLNQHYINKDKLLEVMRNYIKQGHKFILSYNTTNKDFIDTLTYKGLPFDVLYKPFTELELLQHNKDFFKQRMQGFSDNFTTENIGYQLDKILSIAYPKAPVYIDIYKSLLDNEGGLSLEAADEFTKNINNWIEKKSLKSA